MIPGKLRHKLNVHSYSDVRSSENETLGLLKGGIDAKHVLFPRREREAANKRISIPGINP